MVLAGYINSKPPIETDRLITLYLITPKKSIASLNIFGWRC